MGLTGPDQVPDDGAHPEPERRETSPSSLKHTRRALADLERYIASFPDSIDKVEAIGSLAAALGIAGNVDEALRIEGLIDLVAPTEEAFFQNHAILARVDALTSCSAAQFGLGNLDRGRALLDQALELIDSLPSPQEVSGAKNELNSLDALIAASKPFIALDQSSVVEELSDLIRTTIETKGPPTKTQKDSVSFYWQLVGVRYFLHLDPHGLASYIDKISPEETLSALDRCRLLATLMETAFASVREGDKEEPEEALGNEARVKALALLDSHSGEVFKAPYFERIFDIMLEHGQLEEVEAEVIKRSSPAPGNIHSGLGSLAHYRLAILAAKDCSLEIEKFTQYYLDTQKLVPGTTEANEHLYQLYWPAAETLFDMGEINAAMVLTRKAASFLLQPGVFEYSSQDSESGMEVSELDRNVHAICTYPDVVQAAPDFAIRLAQEFISEPALARHAIGIIASQCAMSEPDESSETTPHISGARRALSILRRLSVMRASDFDDPSYKTSAQSLKIRASTIAEGCVSNMWVAKAAFELHDEGRANEALHANIELLAILKKQTLLSKFLHEDESWIAHTHRAISFAVKEMIGFANEPQFAPFLSEITHWATAFFNSSYEFPEVEFYERDDEESEDEEAESESGEESEFKIDGAPEAVVSYDESDDEGMEWEDRPQEDIAEAIRRSIAQIFITHSPLHQQKPADRKIDEEMLDILL